MRGKEVAQILHNLFIGITPAYAGKSNDHGPAQELERDHPRVCGEKNTQMKHQKATSGSPPRMRGKAQRPALPPAGGGITPAYAGKRAPIVSHARNTKDHPRVCGEKANPLFPLGNRGGSPPRMRGKVMMQILEKLDERITPAYAGKRLKRSHRIGHFSCILCLFHSVLHRASASGGSRAGPCAPPCLPAQNAVPV